MSGHTPWRYLIHKSDGPWTKFRKRVGRWNWERRRRGQPRIEGNTWHDDSSIS